MLKNENSRIFKPLLRFEKKWRHVSLMLENEKKWRGPFGFVAEARGVEDAVYPETRPERVTHMDVARGPDFLHAYLVRQNGDGRPFVFLGGRMSVR